MNLDKLWTLVPDEVREKFLGKKNETAPVIDTLALVPLFSLDILDSNVVRAIPKFSARAVSRKHLSLCEPDTYLERQKSRSRKLVVSWN